ncbi:MAG: hypothetical protein WCO56_03215 [Verrucomicrobiota bacterium]
MPPFLPRLPLFIALGLIAAHCAIAAPVRDLMSDTWVATDAIGRTLAGNKDCGAPKANKTVGIFYFLWLEKKPAGIYDISKMLAENPANPKYGPRHAFHHWGEPHLGYYAMDDEWVIRKHAQMLTDAGVDVVIFDVTNALIYEDVYLAICRVYDQIRRTGRATPRIAFIAHSSEEKTIAKLYDKFYSKNLHPDLWFSWKGKPLLLAKPDGMTPQIKSFFSIRESWAWTKGQKWFGDGRDKWPWLDHYPQNFGWTDSPAKPEQITVCVAQHPVSNIGRSFHDGKEPPPGQTEPFKGLCFAEQWKRALEVSPEFVFITGWNEWVAQRFLKEPKGGAGHMLGVKLKEGDSFFVDQYNQEFSRDVEPMRGGHTDLYYYQMVDNIRRYKGARPLPRPSAPKTIPITDRFAPWQDVGPDYLDDLEDTAHRNHPSFGGKLTYVNNSGRNDFDLMKVARDQDNLYFYVRTRDPITPPLTSTNWMWLLLNTDGNPRNGWEGYDFIVNRTVKNPGTTVLERNAGGWKWSPVAEVKLIVKGNELHLAIPRAALAVGPEKGPLRVDFKWADNVPESGNAVDFMDQGDVAPNNRFNYRFEER